MLLETLEHLLTPCPRYARRMGYLSEQIAIRARSRRCRADWQPHLDHSRDVLRAAIARCRQKRKAILFGAGLLNDVPLAELSSAFDEVTLVDVVHSLPTRWSRRRYKNVRLMRADITGAAEAVYRIADDPAAALPRVRPVLFCGESDVDLVASLNLLSQLPFIPAGYLRRRGAHPAAAIDAFAAGLIAEHLEYLRRLPGVVTLIADRESQKVARGGEVVDAVGTLYRVALPWAGEEWWWDLAPIREVSRVYCYRRRVIGIADVKAAPRAVR